MYQNPKPKLVFPFPPPPLLHHVFYIAAMLQVKVAGESWTSVRFLSPAQESGLSPAQQSGLSPVQQSGLSPAQESGLSPAPECVTSPSSWGVIGVFFSII